MYTKISARTLCEAEDAEIIMERKQEYVEDFTSAVIVTAPPAIIVTVTATATTTTIATTAPAIVCVGMHHAKSARFQKNRTFERSTCIKSRKSCTVAAATAVAAAATAPALVLPPATSHLVRPVLPLAIVIDTLVLHSIALLKHVAVGDYRHMAEDVLATVEGLDEPEAARVPAARLALLALAIATATAVATATSAAAAGARTGAAARAPEEGFLSAPRSTRMQQCEDNMTDAVWQTDYLPVVPLLHCMPHHHSHHNMTSHHDYIDSKAA